MDSQAPEVSVILLAGGEGKRMGFPKVSLRLHDRPVLEIMIERLRPVCEEVIVVISQKLAADLNREGDNPETDVREANEFHRIITETDALLCYDYKPDTGPLSGIVSGMFQACHSWTFVVGCDAPLVAPLLVKNMLRYTSEYDLVIPERKGKLQPLHALYRRETARHVAFQRLSRNQLKLTDLLKEETLRVHTVAETEWAGWGVPDHSFANLNTPEDLNLITQQLSLPA